MYANRNFRTKKEFREAVQRGERVTLFSRGLGVPATNGIEYVEGPHYPQPHSWYAEATLKDGIVQKVK